jgi:uncharacterized ion transporter superfamily protein YfcC
MVGPQMPGQNPAQRQMQQQRQRQMEYAWWKAHEQGRFQGPSVDRPGFFVRLILGVISLALLIVLVLSLIGAGWAIKDGAPEFAAGGVAVAIVAGLIRRAVRRKARGL